MPRGKKQVKAGRKEGSKNLQKKGDKIVNQNGVAFTEEEKKKLVSLVNSANRKMKNMKKKEAGLPRLFAGEETGNTLGELHVMGKESDFLLKRTKSKSLNRFESRREYNMYIKALQKVTAPDYIEKRVGQYKKNYIKTIRNVFGAQSKEIVKTIRKMGFEEYMKKVQMDETLEISYLYGPDPQNAKLDTVKKALGIKTAEEIYQEKLEGKK